MSELGPVARSLLAAARDGLGPDAGAAARVRAKLAASIGGAAGGTAAAHLAVTAHASEAASTATNGTAAGTGVMAKLAAVMLAVGVVAGVVVVSSPRAEVSVAPRFAVASDSEVVPEERVRVVTADRPEDGRPDLGSSATAREHAGRIAVAGPSPGRPVVGRPDPGRSDGARPEAGRPSAGHPSAGHPHAGRPGHRPDLARPEAGRSDAGQRATDPPGLAREVELLDAAMASLRKGFAARALVAIEAFERETGGHGQMAEDGAAIAIEARCRLHENVGAALEAFDRRWPSSAQRSRLTAACASH